MGSFNTSCFASRQTIAPGDACVVMPIAQQRTYRKAELTHNGVTQPMFGYCSSTCYPTRFWTPVGSFIEAKYDDYGQVEVLDTPTNRFRLRHFLREALSRTPVVNRGENEAHDVPYDLRTFMQENTPQLLAALTGPDSCGADASRDEQFEQCARCWYYLFEVAQESRMFWADNSGELRPMAFAILHGQAYTELIAMTASATDWEGQSFEMRSLFERAVTSATKRLQAGSGSHMDGYLAFETFREALRTVGHTDGGSYPGESSVFDVMYERYFRGETNGRLVHRKEIDKAYGAFKPWLEQRYACHALQMLNVHFEPMVYASQDYDNSIGTTFARFADTVSRRVCRDRDVKSYGPFKNYSIVARSPNALDEAKALAREYDARLNVLDAQEAPERAGAVVLTFECTLGLTDLRALVKDFDKSHPDNVLPVTLSKVNSAA